MGLLGSSNPRMVPAMMAVDPGGEVAAKLPPGRDPLKRQQFGGTSRQLEAIYAYQKAVGEPTPPEGSHRPLP